LYVSDSVAKPMNESSDY